MARTKREALASTRDPEPGEAPFDALVFVGRFQPFHRGHLQVIARGLAAADTVLVLVGSANAARSDRNPFSFEERRRMIEQAVQELRDVSSPIARVLVRPLDDALYNDEAWMQNVQRTVAEVLATDLPRATDRPARVGIVGHSKDRSSYYLSIFPSYPALDVPAFPDVFDPAAPEAELSATAIRARLYALANRLAAGEAVTLADRASFETALPRGVFEIVERALASAPFERVLSQVAFVEKYRAAWAAAPYAPTFNTVDAVVVQSGHVLMVRRKHEPGRGLFALPGGFVEAEERLLDACVRETYEETQIDLPRRVLLGALRSREPRTFDDPYRSSRGRTFTHAFLFELDEKKLPRVRGGDDAEHALWIPLAAIDPTLCFEDHAHIVRAMTGVA